MYMHTCVRACFLYVFQGNNDGGNEGAGAAYTHMYVLYTYIMIHNST
jgi:hypothetical protein